MHQSPEFKPLSMPVPSAPASDDTLLSDILAFVDTFPADSEQLLNENNDTSNAKPGIELLDDDGNSAAVTPQSKEERKREANRLKDRNKYLRKKERIPKLQAEVQQLTKILEGYERGQALQKQQGGTSLALQNEKEQQLINLSQEKNELLVENAQLRKQFHRATALATNLQQMLNNEHKLYLANSSYFLVLKPLTPLDCRRELRRSLDVIMPSYGVVKSMNRAREICGWNEKRLTERSDFHNWKSKLIRGKSARFVFNQTWEVFLDPFRTEKLFAPIMNVRCRLVQRVDDDNVLFCYDHAASRVLSEKTDIPSASTMALVTRVFTGTGHLIITRGLRRGSVEVQDLLRSGATDRRREIWLETLTWYVSLIDSA
ncbi:hypothetical protein, variant 3 [Phytophthora nicotianae P10297]|uniref:BZIP domain-containing protein n=3 Tax=Phytophthora nicotianae TaxID=4792 RepID=V9FFU0_PHYNI|nr:hypothetical protein, variant 2 [Phytophthora nicotianae P1569]ETK89176.1 hypothetical protein, variant 2 [Phytophthora nicotianae]ETP46980.1 hypothetical protein, variant 2 [Phytophthora nicotianae P10297]ETI49298.1 hypothetical protein, variant 3 [Phytophthora nicotianae P1569]ETK89177.1 hypothetical protein, variant 3 [Phytophthora nicotianae]